jgi:superfamily II DNA or RNA helicase
MSQGSLLFDGEPEREPVAAVVPVDVPQPQSIDDLSFLPFTPRDYQAEASLNSFRLYDAGERGIIVRLFTGAGKTPVASMTAMLWLRRDPNNRVLVLCHERQLVGQFAEEIEQFTGIRPGIEMADQAVSAKWVPLITVASRATLMERTVGTRSPAVPEGCDVIPQGDVFDDIPNESSPAASDMDAGPQTVSRLYKFDSLAHNWLVLIDEGHRYAYKLKSVRHIIDWFEKNPNNWRVLQTATPERGDKVSLSRLAPAIAIDMPLYDLNGGKCGVHEGWAVPYDQRFVTVHGVDFKTLREVSGDFDEGQLEEMLTERKALLSMIRPTLDLVGDRRTIIFSATVGMAKMVAHTINEFARYKCSGCEAIQWEHSDDMKHAAVPCKRCGGELVEVAAGELARSLDGSYADHLRQEVYKQHQGGSFQYLSVCGLCREGYNDPEIGAVAIFRPTKSRSLAEQMKGRGCRPLRGIVNGLHTPDERRAAIAASTKPNAMIIDLVGVTGLADCASTAHIMAEGKPDEVIDLANKKAMEATGPCDMGKMIEEAEAEIEAKKAEAERLRLLEEERAKKRAEARKHQEEERERQRKEMQEKQRVEREAANRMRKLRGDVDYSERQVSAGGGGSVHVKQQGGMRMPFGKHQGKALSELPGGYLRAILEKSKLSPGLTKALRNEMNRRERHREQSLPTQAPTTQPQAASQAASTGDARCTPQQARVLQRFGHSTDVSYAEAGHLIQQINQGLKERKLNFAG